MAQKGITVTNFIDDFIGCDTKSHVDTAFDTLHSLLVELGFTLSKKKLVPPTTKCICLGVEIDTENFTISILEEKLKGTNLLCQKWHHMTTCTKRELQSVLGSLLHVSKCVPNSRFFINRMLETLRRSDKQAKITLDQGFHRDLNWFCTFLPHFNGTASFNHFPIQGEIHLDASLQGLGACFHSEVYPVPIPRGYLQMDIVHLEMLNILVAVRVWGATWSGKTIRLHCDNQAVVCVINSGKTEDVILAALGRNTCMELAKHDVRLKTVHIAGKTDHIADALSRLSISPSYISVINDHCWLTPTLSSLNINWNI